VARLPRFDDEFSRDPAAVIPAGEEIDWHIARLLTNPSFSMFMDWLRNEADASRLPEGSDLDKVREALGAQRFVSRTVMGRIREIEKRLEAAASQPSDSGT